MTPAQTFIVVTRVPLNDMSWARVRVGQYGMQVPQLTTCVSHSNVRGAQCNGGGLLGGHLVVWQLGASVVHRCSQGAGTANYQTEGGSRLAFCVVATAFVLMHLHGSNPAVMAACRALSSRQ